VLGAVGVEKTEHVVKIPVFQHQMNDVIDLAELVRHRSPDCTRFTDGSDYQPIATDVSRLMAGESSASPRSQSLRTGQDDRRDPRRGLDVSLLG
jgi:hypothetical protein